MVVTHKIAQNAFLIYTGFSASNGGHFFAYSTTFLPFFERKFDAYLRRSGGFMCQMTVFSSQRWAKHKAEETLKAVAQKPPCEEK